MIYLKPIYKAYEKQLEPVEAVMMLTTPPAAGLPEELVVRLAVSLELGEAIRELKGAVIMALSVSQAEPQ